MTTWHCLPCGWQYDEEKGDPEMEIAPGTLFEQLPDHWSCPQCCMGKYGFVTTEQKEELRKKDEEVIELSGSAW